MNELVGEELSAVVFVRDYIQFQFDGQTLTVLTPMLVSLGESVVPTGDDAFRNRLCEQIGKTVARVDYREGDALVVGFADLSEIRASLNPADYRGPEAVIFYANDGFAVVL